ncbi:MAG TPA: hypothetical protein VG276_16955 [Actinomycetes bacterium]|nr:hypothetical protein [Actinomycetes bacterium]
MEAALTAAPVDGNVWVLARRAPPRCRPGKQGGVVATVAEQFWREVLDIRRTVDPVQHRGPRPRRVVLVRGGRIRRERRR